MGLTPAHMPRPQAPGRPCSMPRLMPFKLKLGQSTSLCKHAAPLECLREQSHPRATFQSPCRVPLPLLRQAACDALSPVSSTQWFLLAVGRLGTAACRMPCCTPDSHTQEDATHCAQSDCVAPPRHIPFTAPDGSSRHTRERTHGSALETAVRGPWLLRPPPMLSAVRPALFWPRSRATALTSPSMHAAPTTAQPLP